MERKRLYLTVTPELHAELESMAKAGGYRSACSLVSGVLRVVTAMRRRHADSLMPPVDISPEIEELFREYGDSEAGRRAAVMERKEAYGKRRGI